MRHSFILEETHPLVFGVCGSMGNPIANRVIDEADLVIFIGTKAGQLATFGYDIPKPGVPTIHIDIDPEEIGRNFPDSIPLVSDVRLAIKHLLDLLKDGRSQTAWEKDRLTQMFAQWYKGSVDRVSKKGAPLMPQAIMDVVNRFVTEEDLIVWPVLLLVGLLLTAVFQKPGDDILHPGDLLDLVGVPLPQLGQP